MEPWVVAVLAVLAVLILGASSAAFLPLWFNKGRASRRSLEETSDAKAERLHKMVHPDDDQAEFGIDGSDAD